ncbi:hypothetical protein AWB81_07046 [Caballeronia arationis]|nr:hypothetical protein AWB81_07046 [Caballeronia arationis]
MKAANAKEVLTWPTATQLLCDRKLAFEQDLFSKPGLGFAMSLLYGKTLYLGYATSLATALSVVTN